ncbi:MAG: hypothetical protein GY724_02505, partial [Actinomycetia bacterium]|nr:hypothetical protein [Actinomycetes bacterium]
MGRRIEVELTSTRDDGSWTWRAAGARQPKGELPGTLLYDGAQVGDIVKAEAEFHVDGIEITEVFAPKMKKERTDLLELKTRQFRDEELVTTQRVSRGDDRRGGRRGGQGREDRGRRRPGADSGRERPPKREAESRPKPKRLRPRRAHRDALLAEIGDEYRPIVEQVIKDGMPGVRAAIERQNSEAKEAGKPEIDAAPILAIAEKNLSKARLAEWRDRADAALASVADLDLRDLRSVVVAGNDLARDPESREIADKLKTSLDERVEADHNTWLADLESAIGDGRVVRALRLSSRPVKAGAPLPPDLATTLATQASEALGPDVGQERWATVLDALAFSPVRGAVTPVGVPSEPKAPLIEAVKRLADRIPTIAALFGIDPAQVPRSAKRRRPQRKEGDRKGGSGRRGQASSAKKPAPAEATPAPEATPEPAAAPEPQAEATPAPEATPEPAAAPEPQAEATPAPEATPEP